VPQKEDVVLGIDTDALVAYLKPRADLLAVKPVDAIFTEKDGRVTEFVPSKDGTMLDMAASVGRITDAIMVGRDAGSPALELPIITDAAKVQTVNSNPYGIKELIGVGSSNFRGSPKNRRANIDVGRTSLNGILIRPGEEFSLLKALGPVDGEHGYLEELVIKENQTKPEFGGGLCQIGTTTFRAVLASGLPVLERRNHSYRVTYYELDGDGNNIGPGKDATIYEPAPDFKFKNDMATSILIRTYVVSGTDKLVFEFWGTKDGRVSEQTNSVILTSTPPPPKKLIKTTTIPPGTTKCTEHAHPGATAKFTYTVTYPSAEKKENTFMSYYKPWGEVCLAGVTQEQLDAAKAAGEVDDAGVIIVSADAAGVTGETH
jgi:vancomycin resistance protein YoaR